MRKSRRGFWQFLPTKKPYDVFICYKETDENGQRTRDSQWAQDVYYGLTEQGLKVFFSRITLEDKLGQQYEPYIFAALNSAKVMVVIGSKPEYFNAVWVKNEWSRYLSLMKHDHKRLLIPCYRGMDPYDLPEELSMLQSQDMSKIGFMQDLLRGIQKVMQQPTSAPQGVRVETAAAETNAPGVTSLLKRAALFLEDGDTASAREYYDRVLDIDPECAEAYMGKVCAETGCRKESDLGALNYCVDMRGDWQKAVRFASAAQKQTYGGYMASVRARVEEHCHELAIDCACAVAVGRGSRAKMDDALKAYRANCLTKGSESTDYSAEENASWHLAGYQSIRNTLAQMAAAGDPRDVTEGMLKVAAVMFGQIKGEEERAQQCLALAEQARQKDEEGKTQQEKRKRKKRTMTIVAAVLVVAACIVGWFVVTRVIPNNKYQHALALRESGQYEEAIAAFEELGDYSDAKTQITETKYQQGKRFLTAKDYDSAARILINIKEYEDVDKLLAEDDNMIAAVAAAAAARDAKFAVGNYVTFGRYPQTKAGKDKTPIEWLVLARDGNKALLISRYGLDAQPYNKDNTSVTWETCTLRTWLNGMFYNKAFSSAEQAAILTTNVDNSKSQCYSGWNTSGGNNTQDKVFLLSYAEASKYFGVTYNSSNTKSRVAPTAYAIAQGAGKNSSYKTADGIDAGWWWLRSPGAYQSSAAGVRTGGSLFFNDVNYDSGSVRPALWVNIEALGATSF